MYFQSKIVAVLLLLCIHVSISMFLLGCMEVCNSNIPVRMCLLPACMPIHRTRTVYYTSMAFNLLGDISSILCNGNMRVIGKILDCFASTCLLITRDELAFHL